MSGMKYMGIEIMKKAKLSDLEYSDLIDDQTAETIAEGVVFDKDGIVYKQMIDGMAARLNPENLKEIKPVFPTLRKVADNVWFYCGKCFAGEGVERGVDLG